MAGARKATGDLGPRPEAAGGAGPFVVLGVLAACVAGAAGYVLTDNTVKQRQADLAAVTAQQQRVAAKAAQLRPYADFDSLAASRVSTVKDIAGSRFNWDQALRDLARAIPQNVTLKTLNGTVSPTAGGGSSVRSAVSAPAITLDGCAPGQSEVARLMARLRDVDGVTRVSLTKSDATATEAQASTGGSIARRNAAPCGAGARPNFEVVAFFENDGAATTAASSGGAAGTSTPGATATPTATPAAGASATPTPTPGTGTTTASTSQEGSAP
jgi:Tfp pilus assembly protein PilN